MDVVIDLYLEQYLASGHRRCVCFVAKSAAAAANAK